MEFYERAASSSAPEFSSTPQFAKRITRANAQQLGATKPSADRCTTWQPSSGVPTETPVRDRTGYVEGSGQACRLCEGR